MIEANDLPIDILAEAVPIDWIAAAGDAAGDAQKPKRFTMTAYTGGPMQVSAYGPPVVIDLTGITAKAPVPILRDHDPGRVVGHADEVTVEASSLKLSGQISGAGPDAAEVQGSAARGFPWKASVGARPDKMEFVGEGVGTTVNGKKFTGPLLVARKSTLGEVSFVAIAADRKTTVKVAASAAPLSTRTPAMTFDQWIEALGLDLAQLRDDQKTKLQAEYDAKIKAAAAGAKTIEASDPPAVTPPQFDLSALVLCYEQHAASMQAKAAEYTGKIDAAKLAEIQGKAGKAAAELKAKALTDQWAAPRLEAEYIKAAALYEVELLRAERPKGPAIHSSSRDRNPLVIEAAFCRSCGLPAASLERQFKAEVLEAADKLPGFGLQELLLAAAIEGGYAGRMTINEGNLREILRAAFSVHTITTLLTSTSNKILLDGFQAVPQTWREAAQIKSVSDFKQVTAYRMTASLEYVEVGPGGEIQHGTLGQESYTLQAKTYARMMALTRQDIINDDLGAFDDLRNRLGIGAAMKMNKVFWTAWTAAYNGAAFWTAARANLVTSASLGEAGLGKAVKAFRDMAGPDGNLISLEPDRLLLPSDLEVTGKKLFVSQEMRDTTSSTKFQTANIYYNKFRPVIVPELGNSAYTGYSATTWYLLANPAVLASAIMCFLNGVQNPTIESADADFNTLGIQLRGYHDFGCGMSEYRASVAAEA